MSSGSFPIRSSHLERLPVELLAAVLSFLANKDVKILRLTSKTLKERTLLRLDRVFLSANPRSIEVFRAVADHEEFRHKVKEIIWDDAQLPGPSAFPEAIRDESLFSVTQVQGVPYWFVVGCEQAHQPLAMFKERKIDDIPLVESWRYYEQLLQQQDEVISSGADIEAFRYGLDRFAKSLTRVTLTTASHGVLDNPFYETPMFRSFPTGFTYPITRACWPLPTKGRVPYGCDSWELEEERKRWRGFPIIMHELAIQKHGITEFVIDVNELETGLSCRIFDQPCETYNDFVALLQRPGFRRLDLALLADGQYHEDINWLSFQSGYLKRALESIEDPRHVTLRVHFDSGSLYDVDGVPNKDTHWISLQKIFPPSGKWQNLRHFGFSGMVVDIDELITVLGALPSTLRSVELSFLLFKSNAPRRYYDLLEAMRHRLQWHERAENERPRVTVHINPGGGRPTYLCVDHYVNEYLYGQEAPNPFSGGPPRFAKGNFTEAVQRHRFHPDFKCPDGAICVQLGGFQGRRRDIPSHAMR
ncbi:hypothetical protein DPV78_005808 [Talaromyces pinophilus]|nr:hypothetical protein DPV78_005808 [Talaromyces pinophilus]